MTGKVVWITGASSGIGQAAALELARRGERVCISARGGRALEELAQDHANLRAYAVDVTDATAMAETAAAIAEAEGPIDIAVFNAGIHRPVTPERFDPATFRTLLDVNVMGVVNGIGAVLPAMRERRAGRIAIVSSVAGYSGLPTASAYGATKAALINMAESLKLDLDSHGIKVQLICPGFVKTPATDRNPFPMPFLMEAEDAARRIADGLAGDAFEITFPRRFTWQLKVLRMLPYRFYFWLIHKQTGL
ncbi:MAG: SDR family NAD(P)-dependent oxidoreductase [Alphaproteobacteria bacterium]